MCGCVGVWVYVVVGGGVITCTDEGTLVCAFCVCVCVCVCVIGRDRRTHLAIVQLAVAVPVGLVEDEPADRLEVFVFLGRLASLLHAPFAPLGVLFVARARRAAPTPAPAVLARAGAHGCRCP